jgi:hypothetical protein
MWSAGLLYVVCRTSVRGLWDYCMWSVGLVYVVCRTSVCGLYDYSMWSVGPRDVYHQVEISSYK